jgi:hypothetical protein
VDRVDYPDRVRGRGGRTPPLTVVESWLPTAISTVKFAQPWRPVGVSNPPPLDLGQLARLAFRQQRQGLKHDIGPSSQGASLDVAHFSTDKYLHTKEDNTMPHIVEPTEPEAQREIIKLVLNEIATEVGTALREAHLDFPVFLTVPNSGDSVATMACPLDPSDSHWSHASAIVCRIIGQRLGDARLRGRALHCAVANGAVAATDVMADSASEE